MRIKDLATRATKLLTGKAYMVFDNGTKVEKVDYAELAKQIITEYNTQTLAGSAQSVKSALDALNSKMYNFGAIGDGKSYAQAVEYLWPQLPKGPFIASFDSSGYKFITGVKASELYGAVFYINFNGTKGRVINNNGTFTGVDL